MLWAVEPPRCQLSADCIELNARTIMNSINTKLVIELMQRFYTLKKKIEKLGLN